jgi:hypothetical protein
MGNCRDRYTTLEQRRQDMLNVIQAIIFALTHDSPSILYLAYMNPVFDLSMVYLVSTRIRPGG